MRLVVTDHPTEREHIMKKIVTMGAAVIAAITLSSCWVGAGPTLSVSSTSCAGGVLYYRPTLKVDSGGFSWRVYRNTTGVDFDKNWHSSGSTITASRRSTNADSFVMRVTVENSDRDTRATERVITNPC